MNRHLWVVSNPPHREVDHDEVGTLLALATAEARIKVNFWAPEVWLAYPEEDQAAPVVEALTSAGLNVAIVHASGLLSVPSPRPAHAFAFEDDRLVAHLEEGEVSVPYDTAAIGAFCRPPAGFRAGDEAPGSSSASHRSALGQRSTTAWVERAVGRDHSHEHLSATELLERRTNLDLYLQLSGDSGSSRISIAEDLVDFSGLGEAMRPRAADNMDFCVDECERRFTNLRIDRRLVNVRPRRRLTVGGPVAPNESRRLFSFGTVGLQALLESVSPDLAHITQFELGSRLSYLLQGQGAEANGSE